MTKNCNRLRGERPKAFWGALVGGAMNLIGSAISSKSQARAIRRQIEAQKEAARTQLELANNSNLASTLNSYATATRSYNDEDDYNLKYRLGGNKRLGSNGIYITDGGNATKIGNDTYLLRGGSHEQTNETGQTGIGINVGGNEIEAEGGEVAQKKNGALRIFSAQPILSNGMSPAQAILRGYNKDSVFSQQQAFKKRNGLKDDGSAKYGFGGDIKSIWNFIRSNRSPIDNIAALATAYQKLNPNSNYNKQKGKFKGGTFRGAGAGGTWTNDYKSNKGFDNFNDAYDDAVEHNAKTPGGTWNGNVFVPNIWQFGNNGNNRRNKYMNNSGEGYFNGRIDVFPTSRKKHSLGGRTQLRIGGSWKAPVYNTNKYRVSNRMRRQIATWEGSDFAGQNRRFKGDAIGAKERELRRIMGRTYNYLNDNQRDSLNSIYYNSRVDTFKNAFGKWFRNLNSAVDRGDERAFNNSLAGIRQSMTIGANRQGMSGLAKRRAWERNWFGNPIPIVSNETKAILNQQAEAKMVQPTDNTRVVIQPEYIEVPAPVGHGVVPVDNPDPNLLQGNIKDNLINMGNKFRLGQRCGGSTRMRKALGGESRPVKGMRRKLAWGDVTYPYRRNNNFDYWDIIDQEQKANDKGGISPWTTSNKYDVKVPYAITKSTSTIPYTSQVSTPTSGVSENKTIPTYIGNKSGMIIRDADWYGLGADLVSSIGGSILGLGAYKNLDFDYNLPNFVEESPVALNTTYHNEAQKSNVERNRLNSRNSILRNTMSGSTAVGRMQGVDTNALYQLNQLADEKINKETELMNQNLLNEQQVRARNAAARNQYYNTVASIKNAAIQAKNESELAKGQILSGSLQGIGNSFQNFISQGRQNYDDTQAMLMGVAASDYATPSRLLELGVDVGDDAALAGIYRSAMNIPNPGARPKREDYSDNTEYSYALTRWENQNKAYQRRNSYADLIKGRMSKKNLIKYGII